MERRLKKKTLKRSLRDARGGKEGGARGGKGRSGKSFGVETKISRGEKRVFPAAGGKRGTQRW